jgi:hypothetical protein
MLKLRQLHRYLGVFFTPAILFFAFSGALQTFGLHESKERGAPPPVAWIAALASVHKDQHLPEDRASLPAAASGAGQAQAPAAVPAPPAAPPVVHEASKSPLPLKLFVLALAIGLCATSLVGVTIAFSNPRSRRPTALMLVLGTLVPALLLFA